MTVLYKKCRRFSHFADDPNKRELLRITMSLREANKISQSLGKPIVSLKLVYFIMWHLFFELCPNPGFDVIQIYWRLISDIH